MITSDDVSKGISYGLLRRSNPRQTFSRQELRLRFFFSGFEMCRFFFFYEKFYETELIAENDVFITTLLQKKHIYIASYKRYHCFQLDVTVLLCKIHAKLKIIADQRIKHYLRTIKGHYFLQTERSSLQARPNKQPV